MPKIRNRSLFAFVVGYHVLLLGLLPFAIGVSSWAAWGLFLATYAIGGLSITVGYHRLYAHRAYQANPVLEWMVLLGSTLGFEMSALHWSHDHRLHHRKVDTDEDPYSIEKGFWYAHVGWLFQYQRKFDDSLVPDLLANPRVARQHRWFVPLTIIVNVAVFLVGWWLTGPLASFFFGFLLRMAMIHHCTWFINSLCHTFGSKTYARELSAVDNALLALVTFGEGYHNYHHAFASDYRNGVRWYHFDPSKWMIWLASRLGLARNLRQNNSLTIRKSLVRRDRKMLLQSLRGHADHMAHELAERLEHLAQRFDTDAASVREKLAELRKASASQRKHLRRELRQLHASLHQQWKEWLQLTRTIGSHYSLAHHH
jgi:stearoyl-CoA desaturase (delta-9 desaturase)